MNALVLHAHPDDELLFAGALMLSRPSWTWTTVSMIGGLRQDDYQGICLGFPDRGAMLAQSEARDWREAVADLGLQPNILITHNRMGEYGHPHHMVVHRIARDVYPDVPRWDFYSPINSLVGPQVRESATTRVAVTPAKWEQFRDVYGQSILEEIAADKPDLVALKFEEFTGQWTLPR